MVFFCKCVLRLAKGVPMTQVEHGEKIGVDAIFSVRKTGV